MQQIKDLNNISSLENNNKIICNPDAIEFENSQIHFVGSGNVIVIEDGARLKNCRINFNKNDSVIYISKSRHIYYISISANYKTTIFFGPNSYFNGTLNLIASEYQNIIIGEECLFSFGIWIRTADPHLIYDTVSKKRINPSKSILIGDHVWIGQNALILKGSQIGSGSIIGACSVISGKKLASNCCFAGNPVKLVRTNVFYSRECVHSWTPNDTQKYNTSKNSNWIYNNSGTIFDFIDFDNKLKSNSSSSDCLDIIISNLVIPHGKNRFFIPLKKSLFKKHR